MIIELGHFALILAFLCAVVQAGAGFGYLPAGLTRRAAYLQAVLCGGAFAALMAAHLTSDFSVLNVFKNSHTLKPLLYKISGVWGNHEGSIVLWTMFLSLYGAAMARANLPPRALGAQALLGAGFCAYILFVSSPFVRLDPPPVDGADLNPLLQDPGLAFHPPLLYLGATGFSAAFALAVAALLDGKVDGAWARSVRPWVLFAWTCLSAGIASGSWWSYYELGWGGWWFWDPVENASLMPWLLGTALLHSLMVLDKRGGLPRWGVLLALLCYTLAMAGTFLVRSGVLTSIHAFALDPRRGVFLLVLLGVICGGALLLYALRAPLLSSKAALEPFSREGALMMNNLLLGCITATVLTGTVYPLIASTLGLGDIAVGPPYYTATVMPLAAALVLLMGAGPFLPWKKADLKILKQKLQMAFLMAVAVILLAVAAQKPSTLALVGAGLSVWLMTATLAAGIERTGPARKAPPLSQWGWLLAHGGLGLAVAGMIGTGLWTQDALAVMTPGQSLPVGRYTLTFKGVEPAFGSNYTAVRATIEATDGGAPFVLHPQSRHFTIAGSDTIESAIRLSLRDDIYVALGDRDKKTGGWVVRAWVHPLVSCLWAGFVLIFAGGAAALAGEVRKKRHA